MPARPPHKDEFGVQLAVFTGATVANRQRPAAVALTGQVADLVTEQHGGAVAHPVADQLPGQRAEVDVGAVGGPRERDRCRSFSEVASGRHVGQPAGEFVGVVDPFGAAEKRITGQRLAAAAQIVDALGALHKADVRNRIHEATHVGHHAVLRRVGPELPGHLELLVDAHRFGDVDRPVRQPRRIEQLTEPGVAGAGVVPGSLLSAAAPSRRSTTVIDQSGSRRRSSALSVALMIPLPTNTASTFGAVRACGSDTGLCVLCSRERYLVRQVIPAASDPLFGAVYLSELCHRARRNLPRCAPVSVSGVDPGHSVVVAGVNGSDLDLKATASCGSGQSLFDYSPGSNTSTVLLGPPLNGGGVIAAVPYPGQR